MEVVLRQRQRCKSMKIKNIMQFLVVSTFDFGQPFFHCRHIIYDFQHNYSPPTVSDANKSHDHYGCHAT